VTTLPATAPATAPVRLPAFDHGRAGLRTQLAAEWTRVRSVRSTWICLALILVAGIGLSAFVSNVQAGRWSQLGLADRAVFEPVRVSQAGIFISQFVVGVLGALVITSEYGTGSIRTTLATTARRPTVLAAKLLVVGTVILVVSEVTAFASFFAGEAVLLAHGAKALPAGATILTQLHSATIPVVTITSPGVAQAVFLGGIYLLLLTLLACGLGFVLRHSAGAISAFVVILLVAPLIVALLPTSFTQGFERYFPANLGQGMVLVTSHKTDFAGQLLPPWTAAGLLALYVVVVVAVGGALLVRRDA